jgi:hypothetical protein
MSAFELVRGSGIGATDYQLEGAVSAGDTTIMTDRVFAANSRAAYLAIDPFTANCELRYVTGVSGSVVTVNTALTLGHSSGVQVLVLPNNEASIALWGIKADSSTDEWSLMQRATIQAGIAACWLVGADDSSRDIRIYQPLLVPTFDRKRDIFISSPSSGFVPVDALPGAMVISNNSAPRSFTATASDDTFTIAVDPGHVVGNTIAFNTPYGDTFPGGVVAGRVYYIKTKPTATTFTISATDGGATIDVTSNGAGWCYARISSLMRVEWERIRINVNQVDLNGLYLYLQQPGYTRRLRITMNAAATTLSDTQGVGFYLDGQISDHDYIQIEPATNCTGLRIGGGLNRIAYFTSNAVGRMILIKDADIVRIDFATLEGTDQAGIELAGNARAVDFGTVYYTASGVTKPCFKVRTGASASWSVQSVRTPTTSQLLVDDPDRGYTIYAWSGSGDAITTDTGLIFGPFVQRLGYAPVYGGFREKRVLTKSTTLDFGSIGAGASAELTVAVTGAQIGDVAYASPNTTLEANLTWAAYVSSADTVTLRLTNPTASPIDPANSRSWRVAVYQFNSA